MSSPFSSLFLSTLQGVARGVLEWFVDVSSIDSGDANRSSRVSHEPSADLGVQLELSTLELLVFVENVSGIMINMCPNELFQRVKDIEASKVMEPISMVLAAKLWCPPANLKKKGKE
ncbi:hypothetical protein VNO80_23085 [Phaseolus coccineus]|uniref:Uncharacterized protein n=1 Tax=Phaseolus coccineus TaxID=3886 RepID=A0AAN9QUN6_PHACN